MSSSMRVGMLARDRASTIRKIKESVVPSGGVAIFNGTMVEHRKKIIGMIIPGHLAFSLERNN